MWLVRYTDTEEIVARFRELSEARHYVTDVFGPDWAQVTIEEKERLLGEDPKE